MFVKGLVVGWAILVVAIMLNGIATRTGIHTWYQFIGEISNTGFIPAFRRLPLLSKAFLFVMYPFVLGWIAQVVMDRF